MTAITPLPVDIVGIIDGIIGKAEDLKKIHADMRQLSALVANEGLDEATRRQARIAENFLQQFAHGVEEHPHDAYDAIQHVKTALATNPNLDPEARLAKIRETFHSSFGKLAAEHGHDHHHDHVNEEGRKVLPRKANATWLEEMKTQAQEEWYNKKGWGGKTMMIAGTTVCGAVIVHAGVNIKRGLFGYTDPETGEKKQGSISNLFVGGFELIAATFLGKRVLTGNYKFTRGEGPSK